MKGGWKSFWDRHAGGSGGADPYRQVLRVENRQPISEAQFALAAEHIVDALDLRPSHVVLDLCCGNGLLCAALEPHCRRIIGVDFCRRLVTEVSSRTTAKTLCVVGDARTLCVPPESFDRVLIAAALQHFEKREAVRLFREVAAALRPGGILLVTDIPDAARMWTFFDTVEREDACFENEARETPILGTWFERSWLERLGRHAGFGESSALEQPPDLPYARYRFDLLCRG